MRLVRFTQLGNSLHSFERLPSGVEAENLTFMASDGGESQGVLYRPRDRKSARARTVVCFMHPRGDQSRHWAMPAVLEAGFSVLGQAGRYMLNDGDFIYERILLDIAASSLWLRERGFERVIAVGNSGGGTLYALYQAQAVTPPPGRITDTPAGEPCDLNAFVMPPLDAIVHVATHLGQGKLMLDNNDPSVVDENCPVSADSELDMYDERNGFRTPPEPSRYGEEFLARYRAAQLARVARIDAIARAQVERARTFAKLRSEPDFARLSPKAQQSIERQMVASQYIQVHRTQANPALLDLTITPNRREIGSFYSERPDLCNYMAAGFGKWQTPRAWLSTWSYLSSRGSTLLCLPKLTVPTLVIAFTGDNMVFPGDLERIHAESPAPDKAMHHVDGDHFGNPLPSAPDRGGRGEACDILAAWLCARFA
jgi:pimeloyl-ACP methyl ester carboxylesterase